MAYTINIVRGGSRGRLIFSHGAVEVNTECWWDPKVVVDSGTYTGYATRMANKQDGRGGTKREAIWFGPKVPIGQGARVSGGIFIHKGTNAGWSDGCIVCHSNEVLRIWDTINPKEQANVEINIYNTYDVDSYQP
jgi:hypothetical protein